jgi:hypothetical protein
VFIKIEKALGHFYNIASEYHRVNQDTVAAMQFCQSGLPLFISIGSLGRQSKALHQMALIKLDSDDFPGAIEDASKSQRAAKIAGNLHIEASGLRVEAICWQCHGIYTRCTSLLDRAIHLLDLCGMSGGAARDAIRSSQAEVHCCKSEYVEARKIQSKIRHNTSADQTPILHAFALVNIAQIDVEIGGSEHDVRQNINIAGMLFRSLTFPSGLMLCDTIEATLELEESNLLVARSLFQKCLSSGWGQDHEAIAYCLGKQASGYHWNATDQISFPCTVTFLVHSIKYKQRLELHKALQFLGDVFRAKGDQQTAVSLFTVALDGFSWMDVHRSRAECMV